MTSAFAKHTLVQKPSKQHRFDLFGVKIAQFLSGAPKLACYPSFVTAISFSTLKTVFYLRPSIIIVTQQAPCWSCTLSLQMTENAHWTVRWQMSDSKSLLIFRRDLKMFSGSVIIWPAADTATDMDCSHSSQFLNFRTYFCKVPLQCC